MTRAKTMEGDGPGVKSTEVSAQAEDIASSRRNRAERAGKIQAGWVGLYHCPGPMHPAPSSLRHIGCRGSMCRQDANYDNSKPMACSPRHSVTHMQRSRRPKGDTFGSMCGRRLLVLPVHGTRRQYAGIGLQQCMCSGLPPFVA